MNSRERVKRTLEFKKVDRVPRDLWSLPGITMFRKNDLDEILKKFPVDFISPNFNYGKAKLAKGTPNIKGTYFDEWGSEWFVAEDGIIGEVKNPRIKDISEINKLKAPYEILENADFSKVNESCANTDKFVLAPTTVRPFERMQFLRGTENLFIDLGYAEKEIYLLRDILHEFFMKEIEMWCKTDVDGICFMDDWGSQKNLLISPEMWRNFFKPLYTDYCKTIHKSGKYVFFHSDGNISSIYPDLIEIGINAINSQLFCMDIEDLGSKYRGKITFWGEIDRQYILPFATVVEVKQAVRRVRQALDNDSGGVIAQCEFGLNVPKENILAVFEEWEKV